MFWLYQTYQTLEELVPGPQTRNFISLGIFFDYPEGSNVTIVVSGTR